MKTDDLDAWHSLRKGLKRFRYLVVAFAPLYPVGLVRRGRPTDSRSLQDTLGRLQDHHVQATLIESAGMRPRRPSALVAGALADALHRDAEKAHRRCRSAWNRFDNATVRSHLHAVLHVPPNP